MADRRLIEAGFPCHQVGAETARERGSSNMLPPIYYLHVWWARRPLTPSRAAISGSLLPADSDVDKFIQDLGIEKRIIELGGRFWVLTGNLLEKIRQEDGYEYLMVDSSVENLFDKEVDRRAKNRAIIQELKEADKELANNEILLRWEQESAVLRQIYSGEKLPMKRVSADAAHISARIEFANSKKIKKILGHALKWEDPDLYGYSRAYQNDHLPTPSNFTVLDPTSGGGSIPFEALRLGHKVIANELNPVATIILKATLDFPARFGFELHSEIEKWGQKLVSVVEAKMDGYYPFSKIPEYEQHRLRKHLYKCPDLFDDFNNEEYDHQGILYCREVTCPSCLTKTPLLNTCWLSKEVSDAWGVKPVSQGQGPNTTYTLETYQCKGGKGPNGEDPEQGTVRRGIGQCIHCKQAIDGDEIKAQARNESIHGEWKDVIYNVVAFRLQPKLDKNNNPTFYTSGALKGTLKTEKVRYFRSPNSNDLEALEKAKKDLQTKWSYFDQKNLIPTEKLPLGSKTSEPIRYGMNRFCDMFNERQLLGHLTLMDELSNIKQQIIAAVGEEKVKAIMTYLQFGVDKIIDYNSRQTRWHFSRGVIVGTFGRHDYSLKWTYGEMIYSGSYSGPKWGQIQVAKAYRELCELLEGVHITYGGNPPVQIINGTAAHISGVADKSVDLVCMDPPYYDNVQYAELSDFYHVWLKRSLKDLYPEISWPRLTNKREEAVANLARDGSARAAKAEYEKLMGEIFAESRRVVKDNGVMTLMFTHKAQDAWETLTRSLIEAGWEITSCFPVESESGYSTHQMNMASAASTIFITCRKRQTENQHPVFWSGLGGSGVQRQIRTAVEAGLDEFRPLKLNAVDQMIACYGRALQVLSKNWPVMDGDEEVSPIRAMNEASQVVASHQIIDITDGRISIDDLDTETAMALTIYGIWGYNEVPFSEVLNLSKSLNISLEIRKDGYSIEGRMVGINNEISGRATSGQTAEEKGYAAPMVKKGSKLRLLKPEERSVRRLSKPQSDWDVLHGLLLKFREGDIPVARAYLDENREGNDSIILDLLEVLGEEAETLETRNEAKALLFGLRQ
jgi:putative DNA methylase